MRRRGGRKEAGRKGVVSGRYGWQIAISIQERERETS